MSKDASFCVIPTNDYCCDQRWTRVNGIHTCPDCGNNPERYRVRVSIRGDRQEFSYTPEGRKIKNLEIAQRVANHIHNSVTDGTFSKLNYMKKESVSLMDCTLGEFIKMHVRHRDDLSIAEKDFLKNFMAPYFGDVGVFVACQIHLYDFIKTFRLKGDRRIMAETLFEQVVSELKF
jgi:hypothetical protein